MRLTAIAPLTLCSSAFADRYWENGITLGAWSGTNHWSATSAGGTDSAGPPGSVDNAYIANTDGLAASITLDESDTVQTLQIGNTGGGADSLLQNNACDLQMQTEQIGTGTGSVGSHVQSAGANTYAGGLVVGADTGSNGMYIFSGGSITISGTGNGPLGFYVGYNGSGTFNQTGGSVTFGIADYPYNNQSLYLGWNVAGAGTYLLGGTGALSVTGIEYIGYNGGGTFIQSGGTNIAGNGLAIGVVGPGKYSLSAGTLVIPTESAVLVGDGGAGTLNQSGGAISGQFATLIVGNHSRGTYVQSGGILTMPLGEYVGYGGAGTFDQTGGVNNSLSCST